MLQLKNINIKLKKNGNFLFENLNYTLQRGVKCAVIGEEGDGTRYAQIRLADDRKGKARQRKRGAERSQKE